PPRAAFEAPAAVHPPRASARDDDRGAVAEEALVHGHADLRALDLAALGLAAQLPGELADLCDGLGGHGLTEAGEAAARVDRHAAADGRHAVAQQALCAAGRAEADVLVPVELEGGAQVVDL